jgi:hypothetical protein
MELAMQTEQEFLDYVKTLQVCSSNNKNNNNGNGNASSSSSPPPPFLPGSPMSRRSRFYGGIQEDSTRGKEMGNISCTRRRRDNSRSPSRNGSSSKVTT